MEQSTTTAINYFQLHEVIRMYRQLEKLPKGTSLAHIKAVYKDTGNADHLASHWKYKKGDFGVFFLNLDFPSMILLLESLTITIAGTKEFLKKYGSTEFAPLFANDYLPQELKDIRKLILFFNNNEVGDHPRYDITVIPGVHKYGNCENWGEYILGLKIQDQYALFEKILWNYQG